MPAPIARETATPSQRQIGAVAGWKHSCESEHQRSQLSQTAHQKLTCRLSKATMPL